MPVTKNRRRGVALACAMVVTISACGKREDPSVTGALAVDAPPGAPPPAPKGDKVSYTAETYCEAEQDRDFPVSKHAEQTVEVTGTALYYDIGSSMGMIELETRSEKIPYKHVHIRVAGGQPWLKVLPGQTATFRTVVPKTVRDRGDIEWQIVDVRGAPPPTRTVEQFTQEHSADRGKALRRYFQKPVIVTGTITDVSPIGGRVSVVLTESDQGTATLTFHLDEFTPAQLAAAYKSVLKPGAKIRALGIYLGDALNTINIDHAILLDPAP